MCINPTDTPRQKLPSRPRHEGDLAELFLPNIPVANVQIHPVLRYLQHF